MRALITCSFVGLVLYHSATLQAQERYNPSAPRSVKTIETRLPFATKSSTLTVEIADGLAIMEGDIILGKESAVTGQNLVIRDGATYRWPGGRIPFEIGGGFSQTALDDINRAIQHVNTKTNVSLIPRGIEADFVRFVHNFGCSSAVGRQLGQQEIYLADDCGFGSIVHEILHTAGAYHEQSRGDRDTYVEILWNNIEPGKEHNFEKQVAGASDIVAYTYCSIMHYSKTAFGKEVNGVTQETIRCKQACPCIGQRASLQVSDVTSINSVYPSKYNLSWLLLPGTGKDITVGNDGKVYLVGTSGKIYKLDVVAGNYAWTQMPGSSATAIASNGTRSAMRTCVVNTDGKLFEWNGTAWAEKTGIKAKDVAITGSGEVWVVDALGNVQSSGSGTTRWTPRQGTKAVRIAAGGSEIWMLDTGGSVHAWNGSAWTKMPGTKMKDIAVGSDGSKWAVDSTGNIFKWNGATWSQIEGGGGAAISVNAGTTYLVDTSGYVHYMF